MNSNSNELEILLRQTQNEVEKLVNDTTAKLLLHDGKIAEVVRYIKDNLSNSLRCMLSDMKLSGELGDIITSTILYELEVLNNKVNELNRTKKYVFIGDSYAEGYNPDGSVTGWINHIKNLMSLDDYQCESIYRGGVGFGVSNNYIQLIRNKQIDYDVTDVIVGGSYNDHNASEEEIRTGILNFRDMVKHVYPNAKLHIAFIGKSNNGSIIERLAVIYKYYKDTCENNSIDFLEGTHCALQDTFSFLGSDGTHPTEVGQIEIAKAIKIALEKGSVNLYKSYPLMFQQLSGESQNIHWETILQNGIVHLLGKYAGEFMFDSNNMPVLNGKQYCKIADITTGYIVGSNSCHVVATGIPCVVQIEDNTYHEISINIIIRNKELLIQSNLVSDAHDDYKTYRLKKLQVGEFSCSVPALYC